MNTPITTYKYRTQEAALLDLLEDCVYFSKPSEFHETNDKLEGEFEMTTYKSLWTTILRAINSIEKKRNSGFFVHPDIFPKTTRNTIIMPTEYFLKQSDEVGICSTSKTYDNQAMWTHYCKNEGVCFEFEWDEKIIEELNLLIKNVTYSNKPRKFNRDVIFKNMIIKYGLENPKATVTEIVDWSLSKECSGKWIQNFILESTCTKRECWSYENEIRMLSPKSRSFNILKRILRAVYMFIPQFGSPDFIKEFDKSRLLRVILRQLLDNYPNIKLYGLSYSKIGKLIREIPYN